MPYLILIVVVGLVIYFATRGASQKPDSATAASLWLGAAVILFVFSGFMAFAGRAGFAISAFVLGVMALSKFLKEQKQERQTEGQGKMSRKEALAVLGLGEGATRDDIHAAYKRLMSKLHPDAKGSDYLAQKINQARDTLLKG